MAVFGTRKDKRVYRKSGDVPSQVERIVAPRVVTRRYYHVLVTHNKGAPDEFTQEWGTATRDEADRDRQVAEAKDRYPKSDVHWEAIELEVYE